MTTPYLPDDCIYYILQYLQNSHSTLFNCLLVNRFWCKASVPLLYADPFNYAPSNEKIISTLLLCFNKTEILQLKNQLKLININKDININDEYKPLFEYPKYLENFDCYKIDITIFRWLNLSLLNFNRHKKLHENFIPTFYHSILCRMINIKQLNISLSSFKNWNVQTNLTKLFSLKLDLNDLSTKNIELEFLSNIANNCLNLRELEITKSHLIDNPINKKICTIIQKQNNLKAFKLYCSSFLNSILLSLEFQKHSLIYIEFSGVNFNNFSFENLINLCNLKYLIFSNCNGKTISLEQCETLKHASFKLKKLEFQCRLNNNLITSLMIKYLGTSLQELNLFDEPNISIIENISMYCLNLIKLEISIRSDVDLLMFPYFKNLKIRILNVITNYHDYTNNNWYSHDCIGVFKSLASNLPNNVKEITLICSFSCFKEFLENCHCCLEIINFEHSIEILKLILNYIERSNNSLKVLGSTTFFDDFISDEKLELLDQIKAKGVRIVDYKYSSFRSFIV